MAGITLTIDELSSRGNNIRQMLVPLTKKPGGPAWEPRNVRGDIIFATYTGSLPVSNYREWRFTTPVSDLRGMYFEIWCPSNDTAYDVWYLDRAYLSLFMINRKEGTEKEVLCLHCDPHEADSRQAIYKRGPHLHIKAAEEPLPHAHIALNIGFLDAILSSSSTLFEAMEWSIMMIREEILDRYSQ